MTEYDGLKELEELNYELSKASWAEYHRAMDRMIEELGIIRIASERNNSCISEMRENFGIEKE